MSCEGTDSECRRLGDLRTELQESHSKILSTLEMGQADHGADRDNERRRPSLHDPEGGILPPRVVFVLHSSDGDQVNNENKPRRHSVALLPSIKKAKRQLQRCRSLGEGTHAAQQDASLCETKASANDQPKQPLFVRTLSDNEADTSGRLRRGSLKKCSDALNHEFRRHNRAAKDVSMDVVGARSQKKITSDKVETQCLSSRSRFSRGPSIFGVPSNVFTMASLFLAAFTLVMPWTRYALNRALSDMLRDTTNALRGPQQLSLATHIGLSLLDSTPISKYDGLFSPVYESRHGTVPVLWRIPNSGGRTVNDALSYCMSLTISDERAVSFENKMSLSIRTDKNNIARFVNIDTTSIPGLKRANALGLVKSGLVDVIASPFLMETSQLFEHSTKTGRVFAILRHPVDRAIADFVELRDALFPLRPQRLSISQYAHSSYVNENVMAKALANVATDLLTQDDLQVAISVMEHFVVVGLWDNLEESMERFYDYFGWTRQPSYKACQQSFISVQQYHHGDGSIALSRDDYATLTDRNWADIIIWEKAQQLWRNQERPNGSATF